MRWVVGFFNLVASIGLALLAAPLSLILLVMYLMVPTGMLPPNRLDAYSRWLRLLLGQALAEIARDAETAQRPPEPSGAPQGASQALREPTLFLLDEFAALGLLETVERAMGLMAGYGLQFWPILQDMSQLRALYGAWANFTDPEFGGLHVPAPA